MVGSFDGRMPTTRGVEQAIVALKKGAHLLKCGKRGKPKFCPFRLSSDEKTLVWYSKDREKQLSLNSVSTVVLGQKTINFLRQRWPEKESQSLSLIYKNGECSVDLVFPLHDLKPITFVNCNIVNVKFSLLVSHLLKIMLTQICRDRDQAECWYLGLTALISAPYSPFSLVGSKSSRQINNCTNSPHGYIQRKSRLSAVHDTPRYTQVFSDAIEALRVSYRKMNPFCVPFATTNMGSAILAMDLGWMGTNYSISTVCATSNFCILNAANHIIRGETDVMLCGGSDAPLIPIGLGGFVACRALSQRNSDPTKASRPWDVDRDGFVMGEGASVLLLEELEHAKVLEEQN